MECKGSSHDKQKHKGHEKSYEIYNRNIQKKVSWKKSIDQHITELKDATNDSRHGEQYHQDP